VDIFAGWIECFEGFRFSFSMGFWLFEVFRSCIFRVGQDIALVFGFTLLDYFYLFKLTLVSNLNSEFRPGTDLVISKFANQSKRDISATSTQPAYNSCTLRRCRTRIWGLCPQGSYHGFTADLFHRRTPFAFYSKRYIISS
jgi:hypothetical protein